MKKFNLLLVLAVFLGGHCFAQPKVKGDAEQIVASDGQMYMNAEWSPDGTSFAFSGEKYNGIWISDSRGSQIRQLTADRGSGFGYQWSADGQTILSRPVVEEKRLRYHQVKLYDAATGEETVILDKTRSLEGLPVWTDGFQKVAMKVDGDVRKGDTGKPFLKGTRSTVEKTVDFGGALTSASQGVSVDKVVFPQFEGRYVFNRKPSPDGQKIVFEVSGLGLHVSNADGTGVKHLGFGEHASWMPDNRYVVVTKVGDDGYKITSGELFAVDTRTGDYYPLFTDDNKIALKPSVSPDGTKILFDNPSEGAIYMIEVE